MKSYFIFADLINSLLDPRLIIDPGSTMIHFGAYNPIILNKDRSLSE